MVQGLVEAITGLEGDGYGYERYGRVETIDVVRREKWIINCEGRGLTNVA